jgi:hypothetical protein
MQERGAKSKATRILLLIIVIILLLGTTCLSIWVSFKVGRFLGHRSGYVKAYEDACRAVKSGYNSLPKELTGYRITKAELNKPISEYKVYFYIDSHFLGSEDYFRVVARHDKPIEFSDEWHNPLPKGQIIAYSYRWHLLDEEGKSEKWWLAHFYENRDGTYNTIVRLPKEDLSRSMLEVYFEDIDGDGKREDVTFLIKVPDFLEKRP